MSILVIGSIEVAPCCSKTPVVAVAGVVAFFFSSRRRHTRYWRDWSSDVCSSDLHGVTKDQLFARLGPIVRLAPLEQLVDGGAPRQALLARRRLRIRRAVDEEPPEAFLIGGDRGVGEGATGNSGRLALDQRRWPFAQLPAPRALVAQRAQLGRPLGRWEVRPHRDLRRGGLGVEPWARSGRGDWDDRLGIAGDAEGFDQPLHHRSALRLPALVRVDDAAEDQVLLRPGGGDVEQPQLLFGFAVLRLLAERPVVVEIDLRAAEADQPQPQSRLLLAADRQQRRVVAVEQPPSEVRYGDDAELEPLGVVDGHDPDAVVALGGGRGLRLGLAFGAGCEEVEEAAQVAPLARLELRRQPPHLADVGEARLAGRPAQDRQVIAGLGHHRLDQRRQGQARPTPAQGIDRGDELAQQLTLGLRDLLQALRLGNLRLADAGGALHRGPDVAALAGGAPQQPERVRRDPAGGGGEGAEEGVVVERVGDHGQQRADVCDLLLGPVATAADD